MDSNSRMPFFGLELRERKPKESTPSYRSIVSTSKDSARLQVAYQTSPALTNGPALAIGSSKQRTNQPIVRAIVETQSGGLNPDPTSQPGRELQLLPVSAPSVLDSRQNRPELLTSQAPVDFQ